MARRWLLALPIALAAGCGDAVDERADAMPVHLEGPPRAVYVIALQSNAVGGAHVEELAPELGAVVATDPSVVEAWQLNCPKHGVDGVCGDVHGWTALAPRPYSDAFGIELSLGRRLDERYGSIALIKTATNGTPVGTEWQPDAAPGRWQWHYMIDFVQRRMTELPAGSSVAGLILVGCEGDATKLETAAALDARLVSLIVAFRQVYGEVPVVITELNAALAYVAEARMRQHLVADQLPGVDVVPTGDLVFRDGIVHYDAPSFIALGRRVADVLPCPRGPCPPDVPQPPNGL